MATQTRPVKNQIAFHEKINKIENASGNIYLNLEISTVHSLHINDDITIYVSAIPATDMIPLDSFIQVFVLVYPNQIKSQTISFDPAIRWSVNTSPIIPINPAQIMAFHLFSDNCGVTWFGLFSGNFRQ